jgi:hypothetical protein
MTPGLSAASVAQRPYITDRRDARQESIGAAPRRYKPRHPQLYFFDLSNTEICGAMRFSSTSQFNF